MIIKKTLTGVFFYVGQNPVAAFGERGGFFPVTLIDHNMSNKKLIIMYLLHLQLVFHQLSESLQV